MPITARLDGLTDKIRRIEGRAADAIARPWRRSLRQILQSARSRWPVKTGRSRRAIGGDVWVTPDGAVVEASVTVDYATRIKGDPWSEYLADPLRSVAGDMSREIVAELADVVESA